MIHTLFHRHLYRGYESPRLVRLRFQKIPGLLFDCQSPNNHSRRNLYTTFLLTVHRIFQKYLPALPSFSAHLRLSKQSPKSPSVHRLMRPKDISQHQTNTNLSTIQETNVAQFTLQKTLIL